MWNLLRGVHRRVTLALVPSVPPQGTASRRFSSTSCSSLHTLLTHTRASHSHFFLCRRGRHLGLPVQPAVQAGAPQDQQLQGEGAPQHGRARQGAFVCARPCMCVCVCLRAALTCLPLLQGSCVAPSTFRLAHTPFTPFTPCCSRCHACWRLRAATAAAARASKPTSKRAWQPGCSAPPPSPRSPHRRVLVG